MSTVNRVNGMVSGFDTETLVKNLMKQEEAKTNRALREKQSVIWQKDAYKEMMSLFRGFQSDFLDVLKPGSNLRSKTAFTAFTAGAKISGTDTSKVSITTSASSVQGSMTIDKITQLATKDTWKSSGDIKALEGSAVDIGALNTEIAGGNNTIKVTVDGVTKSIDLSGGYDPLLPSPTDLVADLQSKLNTAFGTGKVAVSVSGNKLSLDSAGSVVTMSTEDENVLGVLGFAANDSNVLSSSATLASAFGVADGNGTLEFSINGVSSATMGITAADSIQTMIEKINRSTAGVTMNYSTLTDGFSMKANTEGAANNITLTDTNGFFSGKLKLSTASGRTEGLDAILTVNGVDTTRSTNNVVVDGTTIQLKELSAVAIDVTINANTAPIKDNIVKFVARYNDLIEKVNAKTSEAKYRDFTPLTDEEKADMSESEIKLWESKAKSGLLKSDSILTNMMNQLRQVFNDSVSGAGITLKDMGITTSSSYTDKGKLIIDESKLDTALSTKSAEITAFFTNESAIKYGDAANSSTRYAENGLAARVNDLLNNNIRITHDDQGMKGLLVEKAGYEKASVDTTSDLAKKIKTLESKYATLLERMKDAEERYYAKFTAMESALSSMNAQSTNLSSMFSGAS